MASIQDHFPEDSHTWGVGKIILTTRDHNFQNSSQINQTLFVGELSKTEKLNLFTKIMSSGLIEPVTPVQKEEATQFLDNIPPFPLDISVAAYYLKSANSSYPEYLEHVKKHEENFEHFQFSILKENGSYSKTRYGMITLSLKEIIAKSKDFSELLLLLSLINAQNIPRDLLEKHKDPVIFSNFIYHLNKYSLIMETPLAGLSLHQSTQAIALPYITKQLALKNDNPLLKTITNILHNYMDHIIEDEDFPKMRMMAGHLEKFLEHSELLTDLSKGLLKSELGSLYYFINDDRTHKTLEESFEILRRQNLDDLSSEDKLRLARSLVQVGSVYTELRLYKEAEKLVERALNIYEKEKVRKYADSSWALTHLGNIYRRTGKYEKARGHLEKSLHFHIQYGLDKKRMARTLAYVGSVYRGLGLYQKAIDGLEKSLSLYNKNFSNDHVRVGWILTQLGNIYRDLGNNIKAKQCIENGLLIFKKHFPENHISIGLTLGYLGNCYRELGEYKKSQVSVEQSLKIYQKYSGEKNLRIGWVLFNLASTYKLIGKEKEAEKIFDDVLEIYAKYCEEENILTARLLRDMAAILSEKNRLIEAENYIKKSLKILESRGHIDVYKSLNVLGEIYLKRSLKAFYANNCQESKNWKTQALVLFKKALQRIEKNFPENSIHIERLRSKIKGIEMERLSSTLGGKNKKDFRSAIKLVAYNLNSPNLN